ncbi:MAG: hypothetical protein GPOALKHO_000647 [Sodalis sp.]|nr:MAG: hypothetical protein GPOALKHO_000647 [Sodalis sp.]
MVSQVRYEDASHGLCISRSMLLSYQMTDKIRGDVGRKASLVTRQVLVLGVSQIIDTMQ